MARRAKKSEEVKANAESADEASEASEENLSSGSEVDTQGSPCGGILAAERMEQGFSTKDIAKQLRLSNTQIEALEQDDFASLPEVTIVKGFIRNYAKVLKIAAEPLLSAYGQMAPEKEHYSFVLKPGVNMKITEGGESHKLRYFLMTAIVLSGIGVWFFYQNYVQKPSPVRPTPEIVEALPELALPMSERAKGTSATQLEMPEETQVQVTVSKPQTADEIKETQDVEATVAMEGAVESEIVETEVIEPEGPVDDVPPALGKTRLTFTATQETWLSVVNTSGREVYNKILYAGDRDVIDIGQPSEIVVGNAHGATLLVDGKPIDLAPYTRVNVARVRINRLR